MPPKRQKKNDGDDASSAKKAKKPKEKIPDLSELDFSSDAKTEDSRPWDLKIASWNVNGIRAWLEKDGLTYIKHENPDIFCLQETKCSKEQLPDALNVEGYTAYWLSGDKDGYSGTGMYCRNKPINVTYGLGIEKHDKEGRVITAEYDDYYVVTAYVPNSGRGLVRLKYRHEEWDPDFRDYLKKLEEKKPVIMCGDLNVAHLDIDLANPKSNKKNAGFTKEERDGFTELINSGFVDSFRKLYPDKTDAYSFWTYMMNCRAKNVGWRLDYFVISEKLTKDLCDSLIRTDVMGSDHCPVVLLLATK